MLSKTKLLGSTLIAGMAIAGGMALAPNAAYAQEEQVSQVDEIVVTGSRIRRSPTNSPTPLIQIGQEELMQSGQVNVIDFLADIPALSDVPLSFHPAATRVLGLVTPRSVG